MENNISDTLRASYDRKRGFLMFLDDLSISGSAMLRTSVMSGHLSAANVVPNTLRILSIGIHIPP